MSILSDIGTLIGQDLKALATTTVSPVYTTGTMPTTGTNGQTAIITNGNTREFAYFWDGIWYNVATGLVIVNTNSNSNSNTWTPSEITTKLWLDSNDTNTIIRDSGDLVSQWADKSGNNNHANQSDTALQPSDANLDDGIEFDGNSGGFRLVNDIIEDDMSVYVVMKGDGFIFANDTDSRIAIADIQNHNQIGYRNLYWVVDGATAVVNQDITGHDATKFQILEFRRDGQNMTVRVNSVNGFSQQATSNLNNRKFKIDRIGIKWDASTGVGSWDGNISEIIVTTNTADREKIEGYLAHKWGLDSDLPSGHTHKTSAPTNGNGNGNSGGSNTDNTDTLNLSFADLQLNAYTVDTTSTVGTGDTVRLMSTFMTFTTGIVLRVASVSNSVITVETPSGNVAVSDGRGTQWEKVVVSVLHSNRVISKEVKFSGSNVGDPGIDGYYAEFDDTQRIFANNGYNDHWIHNTTGTDIQKILVKVANPDCSTTHLPTFIIRTNEVTPGVSQSARVWRHVGGGFDVVPAPVQSFYTTNNNPQGLVIGSSGMTIFDASSTVCGS